MTTAGSISWIGLRVDDYLIDEKLGEGAFSQVFRGSSLNGEAGRAFKVAKPIDSIEQKHPDNKTQAKIVWSGFVQDVTPDPVALLSRQAEKLTKAKQYDNLVKPGKFHSDAASSYLELELLEGQSLREKLNTDKLISISVLQELASALANLSLNPNWSYHGDLKPENIILCKDRICLIDPGYFGKLNCMEAKNSKVSICTPIYYPGLEPDDVLAFGIMLFEIACGKHPFSGTYDRSSDIADDVIDQVKSRESAGQYFMSPLRSFKRPSRLNKKISADWEKLLLKGLRLEVGADGLIHASKGFTTIAELAQAINSLNSTGWLGVE